MQTILITGGAGFIGSHLTEHLLQLGYAVLVLDNLSTGSEHNLTRVARHPHFEFIQDTVLNVDRVETLVERADKVVHLAASVGNKLIISDPFRAIENNIHGSYNILRACARRMTPVLVASSSEVYGKSTDLPFRETSDIVLGPTTCTRWLYAASKAMTEFEAQAYFKKDELPVIITRFFNISGPRQVGHYGMVIPRFVSQALAGETLTVYGDGSQSRCFCHVHDLVNGVASLLQTDQAYGAIVNLGRDQVITINDLARLVIQITKSDSDIEHISFEQAYCVGFEDMTARQPDLTRAGELIDFNPQKSLQDIIHDVMVYQQSIPSLDESPTLSHKKSGDD